jgi:8-oxo-dGTP diphosphatase
VLRLHGRGLSGGSVSGRAAVVSPGVSPVKGRADSSIYIICGSPREHILSSIAEGCAGDEFGIVMCSDALLDLQGPVAGKRVVAASGFDGEYFRDGDHVSLDGSGGVVEIANVTGREVVSCAVTCRDRFLLLKRSALVGSFREKWASVSGYVEEGETPYAAALKELREEISAEEATLVRAGKPVVTRKEGTVWISHPFLFALENDSITIDWEHTEYRWIKIDELRGYDTVPGLDRGLASLGII